MGGDRVSASDLIEARTNVRKAQNQVLRAKVGAPPALRALLTERLEQLHAAEVALTAAIYAAQHPEVTA